MVAGSGPLPMQQSRQEQLRYDLGYVSKHAVNAGASPQRPAAHRQQHGLTEAQVAERIGRHIVRLRRSKAATSHPTPDGIRKLSTALDVTAERLSRFGAEETHVIRPVAKGMILEHQVQRSQSTTSRIGERK